VTLYRDKGVVLRTYKLGEADRIVVLLTEGHGKVRAVAKGVRKTKSRFGGRLEPGGHVSMLLYEGRGELDVVSQAETIEHHPHIRADLGRLAKATAMLEAVDHLAMEREPSFELYRMLTGVLRQLDAADSPVMLAGFYWKLLAAEGVAPVVDRCVSCGATEPLVAFDLSEGGALCPACRRGAALSPEALHLLRLVLGGGLREALATPAGRATHELESLATSAMEGHIERRLRSLTVVLDAGR
jgi:DNA repair protein RecO (recombination protein O)